MCGVVNGCNLLIYLVIFFRCTASLHIMQESRILWVSWEVLMGIVGMIMCRSDDGNYFFLSCVPFFLSLFSFLWHFFLSCSFFPFTFFFSFLLSYGNFFLYVPFFLFCFFFFSSFFSFLFFLFFFLFFFPFPFFFF